MPTPSGAPATSATTASLTTRTLPADAEAPQDAADHLLLAGPIDTGDAETKGFDRHRGIEAVDHLKERLLDSELAVHEEVGAAGNRLGHDGAGLVGQEADGLGAARVDADDVAHLAGLYASGVSRASPRAGRSAGQWATGRLPARARPAAPAGRPRP